MQFPSANSKKTKGQEATREVSNDSNSISVQYNQKFYLKFLNNLKHTIISFGAVEGGYSQLTITRSASIYLKTKDMFSKINQ